MRLVVFICLGLAIAVGNAQAQSWQNPDRPDYQRSPDSNNDTRLGELTKAMNKLLDKGERERLADPWFLKDLRELVSRYHRPWSRTLLNDDFSARGTQPQAPWRVTRGEFRVDWRYGLRAVALPAHRQRQADSDAASQQNQQGDAVQQLFGALLNQALKGAQRGDDKTSAHRAPEQSGGSAEIAAPMAISNAFSITTGLTARPLSGTDLTRFSLGVYQGKNGAGYRLVVARRDAKDRSKLRLLRVNGRGGASIVDEIESDFRFDPEKPVRLTWTRARSGEMHVSIDGKPMIRTVDRGFRDPFEGFVLRVGSGDFAVRRIRIDGL